MENFKCNQCGNCCYNVPEDLWYKDLTNTEISQLIEARRVYPENTHYCSMLVIKDKKAFCLCEYILGKDKKPKECADWYGQEGVCNVRDYIPIDIDPVLVYRHVNIDRRSNG